MHDAAVYTVAARERDVIDRHASKHRTLRTAYIDRQTDHIAPARHGAATQHKLIRMNSVNIDRQRST